MGAAIDEGALTGAVRDTLRLFLADHPGFEGADAEVEIGDDQVDPEAVTVRVNGIATVYRPISDHTAMALIAASGASEGAAEMVRFAREGAVSERFPFEYDPVEKLVEAAQRAAEIERDFADRITGNDRDVEGLEKLRDFIAAATLFLEGLGVMDPLIKTAVGPTILLQSGFYFDLLDPHGSHFTIDDIAHGLSMTCRFAGQCREFYSVAEHSWHASYLAPADHALAALMHDAAEAFVGDVTRPLKSLLPEYKAIERNVEDAIASRFGIADWNAGPIKQVDLAMLHAEQAFMMPAHADRWSTSAGIEQPASISFRHWAPLFAKNAFLQRFDELRSS